MVIVVAMVVVVQCVSNNKFLEDKHNCELLQTSSRSLVESAAVAGAAAVSDGRQLFHDVQDLLLRHQSNANDLA